MSSQQDSRPAELIAIKANPIAALPGAGLAWVADRPAYLKLATAITIRTRHLFAIANPLAVTRSFAQRVAGMIDVCVVAKSYGMHVVGGFGHLL